MIKTMTLLSMFLSSAAIAAAPVWEAKLDPAQGGVEFQAIGRPSMLKIVGKGPAPAGSFKLEGEKVSGAFTVDLEKIETGIALRDRHMKEKYLETAKYPKAELKLTTLKLPKPLDGSNVSYQAVPFEGTFKVHGVEKPVAGTADVAVEGQKLSGTASFAIKISDYKIDIPKFAGITMAEDVKVVTRGSGSLSKK
jgi:polyisoprenoid-binding protein YceI